MAITKATASSVAPAAKGDLVVGSATNDAAVLAVGTNDQVLTADSSTTTGLKWAAVAAGSSFSLLNTGGTLLTGATTITVSGISGVDKVFIRIDAASAGAAAQLSVRFNSDNNTNYLSVGGYYTARSTLGLTLGNRGADSAVNVAEWSSNSSSTSYVGILITGCNSSGSKYYCATGGADGSSGTEQLGGWVQGIYNSSSTISSISVISSFGNLDNGRVYVYTSA